LAARYKLGRHLDWVWRGRGNQLPGVLFQRMANLEEWPNQRQWCAPGRSAKSAMSEQLHSPKDSPEPPDSSLEFRLAILAKTITRSIIESEKRITVELVRIEAALVGVRERLDKLCEPDL